MPVKLHELLERTLPALGYELVDCEMHAGGGLVRVFIDKPGGVDVEDCAHVSNHLTHLFAVENIDYGRLEVSSPGLDRPLKKEADFARFDGREAQLKLREPIGNARRRPGRPPCCRKAARPPGRSSIVRYPRRPRPSRRHRSRLSPLPSP